MQIIKSRIYSNIGQISIWLGSVSIVSHILMTLYSGKLLFLHHFQILYVQDLISNGFSYGWHSTISKFPFSPVSCLFFIMLIVGGILYKKTGKKDSRLLRFGFSTIFLYHLFTLLSLPFLYFLDKQNHNVVPILFKLAPSTTIDFVIVFMFTIIVVVFSFWVTKWLSADQKIRMDETVKKSDTIVCNGVKANLSIRFVHFLFDKVMAIYFVTPFVISVFIWIITIISPKLMSLFGNQKWMVVFILALSLFLYYLVTEGVFRVTPIKCLTGTRVVDMYKYENATFGHVLGRSLCRFIPFDSLSFFWKGDWHDNFSETLVVEEDNYGQHRRYHIWWIVAFISIYLVPYLYMSFQAERMQMEYDRISTQHRELKNKSSIYHLENGDYLEGSRDLNDYNTPHYLLKVIAHDTKKVVVERYLLSSAQSYVDRKYILEFNIKELELIDTLAIFKDSLLVSLGNNYRAIIINDTVKLKLEKVFSLNHPEIHSDGVGSSFSNIDGTNETEIHMDFSYDLMPINIINIENLEGSLNWDVNLPLSTDYDQEQKSGSFSLKFTARGRNYTYKSRLTLQYGDKLRKYILEGNSYNRSIYLEY